MKSKRKWFLLPGAVLLAGAAFLSVLTKNGYLIGGTVFYGAALLLLAVNSLFAGKAAGRLASKISRRGAFTAVLILTVLLCVLPAELPSVWTKPGYSNHYEHLAESLLNGRLSVDFGDNSEAALSALDNPYSPAEREESGVRAHWDYAFYHGKYYVYFGIVPALLLFLPFRFLFGVSLPTPHATQIFAVLVIAAIFSLFDLMKKRFFPKMRFLIQMELSAALSVMSTWYFANTPGVYCCAIAAGAAFACWSLYFFCKAAWLPQKKRLLNLSLGALLGALVFGCRPPIGLANLAAIPLWFRCFREAPAFREKLKTFLAAALPYLIVAAGLCWYNFARFGKITEFGQSYQITVSDQTAYVSLLERLCSVRLRDIAQVLLLPDGFLGGAYLKYPLLLLSFCGIKQYRNRLHPGLHAFRLFLFLSIIIIATADVAFSPVILERYRSDSYFLAAVLCFFTIGLTLQAKETSIRYEQIVLAGSLLAVYVSILLFLIPFNNNYSWSHPEVPGFFFRLLTFGHGDKLLALFFS